MMSNAYILIYAFFFLLPEAGGDFPSDDKALQNSAKTFELFVTSNELNDPPHTLNLRNLMSGVAVEVLTFSRHVEVQWSAGGEEFFVNDYEGSNRAKCLVAKIADGHGVKWITKDAFGAPYCTSMDATDHCNAICVSWLDDRKITGEVLLYGEKEMRLRGLTYELTEN